MSGGSPLPPLRRAASLIVFRNGPSAPQILMGRRGQSLVFGSGRLVFPGGRIDAADDELAAAWPVNHPCDDHEWNAARVCAIRETLEETGLLVGADRPVSAAEAASLRCAIHSGTPFAAALADADLSLDPGALVPFARWQPPFDAPRRFDTRFFLTGIGTGDVALSADGNETSELAWLSAQEMLARHDEGQEELMFPTRANLMHLAKFPDFAAARSDCHERTIGVMYGIIEDREEGRFLTVDPIHGFPDVSMPLDQAFRD